MNQSTKLIISVIIAVVVVAIGYSVFKGPSEPISTEPIKIGFIGPLTGENAAIGKGIKNAISLSAKDKDVQIIYEDDKFKGKLGVTAYHKLRNVDKVDAIINTTPATLNAITPLLKDDPIVVMQIAQPKSSADDTIFQIMPNGVAVYTELGKIAKEKYQSFAFIYQNGATFEKTKNHFKSVYEDQSHLIKEYRLDKSKDYRTLIAKIKSNKPAAYTVLATPSVGSQFIKQMREQQVKSDLVCNGDMEATISQYLKVLPEETFNGCISAMFADRMSESFKSDYKDTFGNEPGFGADYGFDGVEIITNTYDSDMSAWIRSLKNLDFDGVSGKVKFDDEGIRIPEIATHIFKNGEFTKIE